MTPLEILILLVAGLIVGFINTLAGGATTISLSVLMFMGLPLNVANESVSYRYGFGRRAIASRADYFQVNALALAGARLYRVPTTFSVCNAPQQC